MGELDRQVPPINHLLLPSHPAANDLSAGCKISKTWCTCTCIGSCIFACIYVPLFVLVLVFPWQARRACQRQRSILLEFDTRGEVEDFQRLVWKLPLFETYKVIAQVRDEHLLLKPNQLVWLGATYQQVHQVLLNMFNINSAININITSTVNLAKYHT